MEVKQNPFTNKFISQKIKEKFSRDDIKKFPYDIVDSTIKKNKSLNDGNDVEKTLLNFFMYKNHFTSHFDRKGAKKFLNEKEKAMEKIILFHEIKENKHLKLTKKTKKSKSHKNVEKFKIFKKYKHLKQHRSHKKLVYLKMHNFNFNKKQILFEENKDGNDPFVSLGNMNDFNNNNIDSQQANKQKGFIETTKNNKNKLSIINRNEPSYLLTGENDSFIYSIVKEMN